MKLMASVQKMERAREGVAVLLSDVWHSAVVKHVCVTPRIIWIKFKFSRVTFFVVVVYGPNEAEGEERDRFGTTWTGLWIV